MRLPGVLMGFTFHEFGHAWVATKFGDETPRHQGRVTLDPRAQLDPIGTILLLIGGFGWAKPVETDPSRIRPRALGNIAVAVAGVAMNFLLALVFYALYVLAENNLLFGLNNPVVLETLWLTVWMQVIMIGFNLIPLPPLDGFHVVRWLAPAEIEQYVLPLYRLGPIMLFVLFATPFASRFMGPIYRGILSAVHWVVFPPIEFLVNALAHVA